MIGFISLLDTINAHNFADVTNLDWSKIVLKSLIPGLIAIKAFLDTTSIIPDSIKTKSELNLKNN